MFAVPTPSVTFASNPTGTITVGDHVTLMCTVKFSPLVTRSDVASLISIDAQLSRDGAPVGRTGALRNGTTSTYITEIDSFGRNESGVYSCTVTVRPQSGSSLLTYSGSRTERVRVTVGK